MNILSTAGQGLFRVWASDGIHTSSDTSDGGFTVTTRAPELSILSPEDGLTIAMQQTLNLQALAFSDIAGVLNGGQVRWVSNIDGLIATGNNSSVTGLSEGLHTIIISANDGERTAFANLQVLVVADPSLLPESVDELLVAPQAPALHPHLGMNSAQLSISNASGTKPLGWQAFKTTPCLQLDKISGTTTDQVTVTVDATGLGPGVYSADIVFLTPDIPGGISEIVTIAFNISPEPELIFLLITLR
jgi:hypothetical protein